MTSSSIVRPRDSILPAAIGGAINGVTAWVQLRGTSSIPLSVDVISSTEETVWSRGVAMAFTLGFILTLLDARRFRKHAADHAPAVAAAVRRPFFPFVVGVALHNALFLFGVFVVLAVMWQRVAGTVHVSAAVAAVLIGVLGACISFLTALRTRRAMLRVEVGQPLGPRWRHAPHT